MLTLPLLSLLTAQARSDWGPCPDDDPLGACRRISVPRDHDAADGPSLELAVKRYPPPSGTERGQLWHITGGPGDSGLAALPSLGGLHAEIAPDYALLTLDVRGVGFSDRLSCAPEEMPDSPEGRALDDEEWLRCADSLTGDERLPTLTTIQTARDLVTAVEALRGEG
ncbi:MAG: hypothetical protein AAF602_26095, partial [Myxococcota bacterium]